MGSIGTEKQELAELKRGVKKELAELGHTLYPLNVDGTYFNQSRNGTCEFVYYQDNSRRNTLTHFRKVSDRLVDIKRLSSKSDGTASTTNQVIITPDNILFLGMSLSGPSVPIWRKAFREAGKELGVITAEIEGPVATSYMPNLGLEDHGPEVTNYDYKETGKMFDFVRSDGKSYNLTECEIYFMSGLRELYEEKIKYVRETLRARNTC